ncbi:MAG: hypothetical protein KC729_10260, partial [Candidatus Eisenbacteria bacterium]|nr:hypothetical protein [Candidatus Eisenbacteria bacterium]
MGAVPVTELVSQLRPVLRLESLTGEIDARRAVTSPDVNRPGLALTGFTESFRAERMQIFGATEMRYLATLTPSQSAGAVGHVMQFGVPAVVICRDLDPAPGMLEAAHQHGVPVLRSPSSTIDVIHELTHRLEDALAPTTTVHGSLVDVYGVGILITGRSAIGKSECALDLVERGHRLVADDVVTIKKQADNVVIGR